MLKIKKLLSLAVAMVMLATIASGIIAKAESDGKVPQLVGTCPVIDTTNVGKHIQNTMHKLQNGEPVTICLYGQSITSNDNAWTVALKNYLVSTYPQSKITWKNIAVGGWGTVFLKHAAQYDFKDVNPDLVLLYVYGSHVEYEEIVKNIREHTTAELMMLGEHKAGSEPSEGVNPLAKLATPNAYWSDVMTYDLLPTIATKYDAEFCDIRTPWAKYLADNNLDRNATALSTGNVHLNAQGEALMFNLVKQFFVYRPEIAVTSEMSGKTTYAVGTDVNWVNGTLTLPFQGNKVEVVVDSVKNATANVLIDNVKPSLTKALYTNARVTPNQDYYFGSLGAGRRTLYGIDILGIPTVENLSIKFTNFTRGAKLQPNVATDYKYYYAISYEVVGDKTGTLGTYTDQIILDYNDGTVTTDATTKNKVFTSNDGKFSINVENFRFQDTPVVNSTKFTTDIHYNGLDTVSSNTAGTYTLAQGLDNGTHTLTLTATDVNNLPQIKAINVYKPQFPKPVIVTPVKTKYTTYVKTKLYSAANTKKAIKTIAKGKTLTFKSTKGSFFKITYAGKTGYVKASDVSITGSWKMKLKAKIASKKSPSAKAKNSKVYAKNASVTIIQKVGNYYKIKGTSNWILKSKLK